MEITVTKPVLPALDTYMSMISGIWDREWLTNFGQLHNQLEELLIKKLMLENLALFTNGHIALESALEALELTGEVITTPFTFASTTNAILRKGLTPVFCDIDAETYCIDANKIEALITPKTSAILPVHVYGNVCDVEKIEEIAKKYGLKVLYDAAHGFGVEYKGRGLGCYGDAAMFSFHATKIFHTIEGGGVAVHDIELKEKLHQIQNFGYGINEDSILPGGNGKMNEFQAAMGLCNLETIDDVVVRRSSIFQQYNERLCGIKGITLPITQDHVRKNYAYYYITVDKEQFGESRDEVHDRLKEHGVLSRKYFSPITSQLVREEFFDSIQRTDIARKVSDSVLVLPVYTTLSQVEVAKICSIILEGH